MPFLPNITRQQFELSKNDDDKLFDLLATSLHEGLYHHGSFDFLDELTDSQQLLLSFDYLRSQVGQGGFIQFLHNGYVALLPEMPRQLTTIGDDDMSILIDEVLKLFVEHHEALLAEMSPQDFAKLYISLPAFAPLDAEFEKLKPATERMLIDFARAHTDQFGLQAT